MHTYSAKRWFSIFLRWQKPYLSHEYIGLAGQFSLDSEGKYRLPKIYQIRVRYEKIKELLENMLDEYPHELPFYQEIIDEYNLRQIDYEATLNKIITENQENLAGKYLMTRRKPFVSPNLLGEERKNFLKQHFFDKISFDDKGLLYTNAYQGL